jgi:hypothetical protein
MADSGARPAACACRYCARPISAPSPHTQELFDMFWALNGATGTPRRARARHNPVTTSDFPASEDVPAIRTPLDPPASLPTGAVYGVST